MARLHFQCPKTGGWFSAAFENVRPDRSLPVLVTVNRCRFCGESHRYKQSEMHRSRPAGVKNPKVPAKKQVGFKIRTGSSLARAFRPKDPCYGRLNAHDQTRAEAADLASTLFMLEGELTCTECGQYVGAKKSLEGRYEPDPNPHERYKEPRKPARKRGPYKRM